MPSISPRDLREIEARAKAGVLVKLPDLRCGRCGSARDALVTADYVIPSPCCACLEKEDE